ncbi:GTPase involved in cell partitioning and DNA repair [Cytobacillus horneckiae]|uniref:Sporulation protein n=1 Tax=Cytobacillus horneckiae TaxID=549687 RepID=A0A2N0ZF72_9BACI|nr:YhcN/YlaJ family sporulation lipoprotein [Cytobacillus horneckiae]NRG46056.1 YhcN/YlaJ family sporulation lipoprotein [Bacillus sp. CRN 9]MBN6887514.1 YhcN/YlaJ family sporulation lipoprotein [Cytobacillus horneckiae]MCM3178574.1 YhcN/YlaJ family sporulation lipoprotein [Cytobacillus horneckiae]MEC1155606.1 YhcN/YlaJ family sporulation lipoprotein [Cytobacillus horneckiae]MED2936925.1 YhcN/YlaJ family sporulation lipoprotein [Cytobacillus horneckiae]
MKKIIGMVLIIMLITGCSKHESEEAPLSLVKVTHPTPSLIQSDHRDDDAELLQSIEKDVEDYKELYDAAIVKNKDQILVAYKVKHLQRFHMKKIEKKLKDSLEKDYPDVEFIVSSDFKIFLEVVELHEKMKSPEFDVKKAEKKFNNIVELQKELT